MKHELHAWWALKKIRMVHRLEKTGVRIRHSLRHFLDHWHHDKTPTLRNRIERIFRRR